MELFVVPKSIPIAVGIRINFKGRPTSAATKHGLPHTEYAQEVTFAGVTSDLLAPRLS
jgi:hypothetical protein